MYELAPSRWQRLHPHGADHVALVLRARQQQTRRAGLAQTAQHRFEHALSDTARGAGQDQVEADVAGLGQELAQLGHRVALAARDHLVVVDEQEQVRARPLGHLAGGRVDLDGGEPLTQGADNVLDHVRCAHRVHHVADLVGRGDRAQHAPPVVQGDDLGLVRRPAFGDTAGDGAQRGGLARLHVADHDEVRLAGHIQGQPGQVVLVDPQRDELLAVLGNNREFLVGQRRRQQSHRRRRGTLPGRRDPGDEIGHTVGQVLGAARTVDAGQRGQEVQLLGHQTAPG